MAEFAGLRFSGYGGELLRIGLLLLLAIISSLVQDTHHANRHAVLPAPTFHPASSDLSPRIKRSAATSAAGPWGPAAIC